MTPRLLVGLLVVLMGCVVGHAFAAPVVFPLHQSSNSRYLEDANGVPFPILGRASWGIIGLSPTAYRAALAEATSKGFNAIEFRAPNGSQQDCCLPRDGAGNLPFLSKIGGGAYTGSFSEAPDFTTPNEAYWSYLDTFIDYCASQGIAVLWFPAYIGYDSDSEGWGNVMVANGPTKMQSYGAFVANRYKDRKNIIWMLGGDKGTSGNPFTSSETTVERAFITGLKSVTGQQSTQYAAEWASNSYGDEQVDFGSQLTLNGVYSFGGNTATWARTGYADSPTKPTFLLEEPYDEEGPDGTNKNPSATQPVRRFVWWAMLNSGAGYMAGNGYLIHFFSGYTAHFSTQGQIDLAMLNALWKSIPWYELVPSRLGGMKTIVVTGGSSPSRSDYVAAAATPSGTWLLAYVPPAHSGSITVDMTVMGGVSRARWWNPTNGVFSDIGAFPATGSQSFTPPGNNGTGFSDWVLVLDTGSASARGRSPRGLR